VRVPKGVDLRQAAFATLGAIALEGIHRAELTPGETVGVIGLGLIGQLTALILKQYNFPVLGMDLSGRQVERARSLGITALAVGDEVHSFAKDFSQGRGLDAVIVTAATASSDPVRLSGELCRERGRVSAVGLVGMDIPRSIYYEKELDFRVSRSYGPGRYDPQYEEKGHDYPIGHVRWTENRNLEEFLRLLSNGLDVSPLITHTRSIENAEDVYEMLLKNPRQEYFLGVLFEYPREANLARHVTLKPEPPAAREGKDQIQLGVIGPGNFARATLLPVLNKMKGVSIRAICSATGRSAEGEGRRSGAVYITSQYQEVLSDKLVDAVVIATRHNLHARIVVEALAAGKHVFVEKPLALCAEELCEVARAVERAPKQLLMVGYNRRFSVHTRRLKQWLAPLSKPYISHYRVNAGYIEPKSWVHDTEEGGGRIVGEVCHFVDLLQYLAGSAPVQVFANEVGGDSDAARLRDNLAVSILFADGSVGNIIYTALGSRALPKERIEVFAGGRSFVIDNFRSSSEYGGSAHEHKGWAQDKGHTRMLEEFIAAIKSGKSAPISVNELLLSSLSTFAIVESVDTGLPARVGLDSLSA
jgi:predicted dehydrogenase